MARYSAHFWNNVLRKLLPSQRKTVGEVAAEFGISTATIYGWKATMSTGTLQVGDGAQEAPAPLADVAHVFALDEEPRQAAAAGDPVRIDFQPPEGGRCEQHCGQAKRAYDLA